VKMGFLQVSSITSWTSVLYNQLTAGSEGRRLRPASLVRLRGWCRHGCVYRRAPLTRATLLAPDNDAFPPTETTRQKRRKRPSNPVGAASLKKAGVPGSAHGVRKLAATRMANNGATEAQLMAVFGWTDPKMAAHYTHTANRKRLAAQSIDMLNASGTSIPAPGYPVREKGQKAK
jgi:integrase